MHKQANDRHDRGSAVACMVYRHCTSMGQTDGHWASGMAYH